MLLAPFAASTSMTALLHLVVNVVLVCSGIHMARILTPRMIAGMQSVNVIWQRSQTQNKSNAVRVHAGLFTILEKRKICVFLAVESGSPAPAFIKPANNYF